MTDNCPMTPMDRILLPVDGSEFCEGAIREGIKLAKICSSRLIALSVVEANEEFMALAPELVEKAEREAHGYAESVRARAAEAGVDCETAVHVGNEPFRFIIDEAEKRQADLIIMGRRGRSGFKRLMMGSVTARVIGHAPCKVLVAPRAANLECKTVLVATDGSSHSDAAAIEAINIARRCESFLIVISVASSEREMEAAEENVKKVTEIAERENLQTEGIVVTGVPFEAILETSAQRGIQLVVLGSHGRTGIERLMMGSVTERVITNTPCAVLVTR